MIFRIFVKYIIHHLSDNIEIIDSTTFNSEILLTKLTKLTIYSYVKECQ